MHREKEIEILNRLRIPLLLGVVMIHSNTMSFSGQVLSSFPAYGMFMKVWEYILSLMVPAFFFISGYMFFRSGLLTRCSYASKLKHRIHSIAIPYLIWNLAGLILAAIKALPLFSSEVPQYSHIFDSPLTVISGFFALPHTGSPYDMPLWFLRNLMIMALISPVISFAFKHLETSAIVLFAAICVEFDNFPFALQNSLWFFSLGAAMPILEVNLIKFTHNIAITAILFIACITISLLNLFYIPPFLTQTCGIFLLVGISNRYLNNIRFSTNARSGVFFIYACHGLYAIAIDRIIATFITPVILQFPHSANPLRQLIFQSIPFICYVGCFVINIVIAWALFRLFNRFTPRFTRILCGNR